MWFIQWFGEQSDTVKLGFLGFAGGIFTGLFSIFKAKSEAVSPVMPEGGSTSASAPASADDPALLILAEVVAMNIKFSEVIVAMKEQDPAQNARIAKVVEEINELTSEIYLLRNMMSNRQH